MDAIERRHRWTARPPRGLQLSHLRGMGQRGDQPRLLLPSVARTLAAGRARRMYPALPKSLNYSPVDGVKAGALEAIRPPPSRLVRQRSPQTVRHGINCSFTPVDSRSFRATSYQSVVQSSGRTERAAKRVQHRLLHLFRQPPSLPSKSQVRRRLEARS